MRLQELHRLFLQHQADRGSTEQGGAPGVGGDGELRRIALPDVLLVIVMFRSNNDRVGNWGERGKGRGREKGQGEEK